MQKRNSKFPLLAWTIAFAYLALLSALLLAPDPWWHLGGNSTQVKRLVQRTVSDYALHGLAFMVLAILFLFALRPKQRQRATICLTALAAYSLLLELLQLLVPSRSCHLGDMLANLVGLSVGWFLFSTMSRSAPSAGSPTQRLPID